MKSKKRATSKEKLSTRVPLALPVRAVPVVKHKRIPLNEQPDTIIYDEDWRFVKDICGWNVVHRFAPQGHWAKHEFSWKIEGFYGSLAQAAAGMARAITDEGGHSSLKTYAEELEATVNKLSEIVVKALTIK